MDGIAAAFGLGNVIEVTPIRTGTVTTSSLTTTAGRFHVKTAPRGSWPGMTDQLAGSSDVKRAAWALGVDMAEPVTLGAELDGSLVFVHRWIEGRTVTQDDIAEWAGRTVARLHEIDPPPAPVEDVWADDVGVVDWRPVAAEIDLVAAHLDTVLAMTDLVATAAADLPRMVGSHRDIHGLNVVIGDDEIPRLVDWELAGRTRPWFEITRLAYDLGRNRAGRGQSRALQPVPETAARVVRAYVDAGGERGPTDAAATAGTFGIALARLRWEADLWLGVRVATAEELRLAEEYFRTALPKLEDRWADRHRLASLVRV